MFGGAASTVRKLANLESRTAMASVSELVIALPSNLLGGVDHHFVGSSLAAHSFADFVAGLDVVVVVVALVDRRHVGLTPQVACIERLHTYREAGKIETAIWCSSALVRSMVRFSQRTRFLPVSDFSSPTR